MISKRDIRIKADTKQGILHELENHMSKTYEKIKEAGEYEYGKNLVKTYLVESNFKSLKEFFDSTIHSQNGNKTLKLEIVKIENSFSILTISKKESKAIFYADTSNPRFWILHTRSNVKDSDYLLNSTIQPLMSHLDNLWLDRTMLEKIREKHADFMKSIGVQYRYGDVFPSDDVGATFTMRAHGTPSEKIFQFFRSNEEISNFFAISSVGFKKTTDPGIENPSTIIEDVNYWGKFSVKGTSFYEHMEIVDDIQARYQETLNTIEEEFNLSYSGTKNNIKIHGSPALIELKREIENIEIFIKTVFSSREPFRLSGYSKKIDSETALVSALDLHNGDDFNLEITPTWMRVYLPEGACGNTIMRFICNLQRYYDANAVLESLSGLKYGSNFESQPSSISKEVYTD
jgi:hypothetical protein